MEKKHSIGIEQQHNSNKKRATHLDLCESIWQHVWLFVDMKDAARMATVHSKFRMAPWCCSRLVVEGENRLLTNKSHAFQLRKWLDKDDPTTKPVRKLQLLYRMTRDGASAKVFHELCDGKGPTVTLIQGFGDTPDYIFGGYTDISWASPEGTSECADPLDKKIYWSDYVAAAPPDRNDKSFLFAFTYARMYKDKWEFDSDDDADDSPFRTPYRFCWPGGSEEVFHCRGLGPTFFGQGEEPRLFLDGAMKCRIPGGGLGDRLNEICRFECEDDRVVHALVEGCKDTDIFNCDFLPFEFHDTEVGRHERPTEVEVYSVN